MARGGGQVARGDGQRERMARGVERASDRGAGRRGKMAGRWIGVYGKHPRTVGGA